MKHVIRTLRPGVNGTKRLAKKHGPDLLCVRYREDPDQHKRYKTIELIVDMWDYHKPDVGKQAELSFHLENNKARERAPQLAEETSSQDTARQAPKPSPMFRFRCRGWDQEFIQVLLRAGVEKKKGGIFVSDWDTARRLGLQSHPMLVPLQEEW